MKKLLFIILSVIAFIPVRGALTAERGKVADAYNFWLYSPDTSPEVTDSVEKKPLIIFLHGASLCGTNLERVRRYGTIDALDKGREIDAYVIAPQNPGGSWKPSKIMKIVDWVEKNCDVDTNRVYVLGMSLGGYGTIDLAATYPDRIAAAMALCGGATVSNLGALNEVPLWIVHGTADKAVSISQSDKVVAAMKKADGTTPRLIYNRVPGMNHSMPARMFYLKDSYDWLLSHSLQDEGRRVNNAFPVSNDRLRTAYQGLKFTKTYTSKKSSKSKKRSRRSKKRR